MKKVKNNIFYFHRFTKTDLIYSYLLCLVAGNQTSAYTSSAFASALKPGLRI